MKSCALALSLLLLARPAAARWFDIGAQEAGAPEIIKNLDLAKLSALLARDTGTAVTAEQVYYADFDYYWTLGLQQTMYVQLKFDNRAPVECNVFVRANKVYIHRCSGLDPLVYFYDSDLVR